MFPKIDNTQNKFSQLLSLMLTQKYDYEPISNSMYFNYI